MLLQEKNYRQALLFCLGTTTALRPSDLVTIRVGQVRWAAPKERIPHRIKKTKKKDAFFALSDQAHEILKLYLKDNSHLKDSDFLFPGQHNRGHLSTKAVNMFVKRWTSMVGLGSFQYGGHTLRKTAGYHKRKNGKDPSVIKEMLGHRDIKTTDHYLGVTHDEICAEMGEDYF
jgi:integrase